MAYRFKTNTYHSQERKLYEYESPGKSIIHNVGTFATFPGWGNKGSESPEFMNFQNEWVFNSNTKDVTESVWPNLKCHMKNWFTIAIQFL